VFDFCHRDYFRLFRLNVEQYGEILFTQAFRGRKMGDEQVGYDIEVTKSNFNEVLGTVGVDLAHSRISALDDPVRIEVKSKISPTIKGGKAEVINVKETKLDGVVRRSQKYQGMTHLAVILVYPGSRASRDPEEEGLIEDAWLLPLDRVVSLRNNTNRKGKSLSVKEIRGMIARERDIINIKPLLEVAAKTPLLEMLAKANAIGVLPKQSVDVRPCPASMPC
jgi:hypothetical protein